MDLKTNNKDLNSFLGKVDEINSIMKNMTSDDKERQKEAMRQADKLIGKVEQKNKKIDRTGENRTVINQSAFNDLGRKSAPQSSGASMDQEAFMSVMEQDAEERYQRRLESKSKAIEIKEKGNIQFKEGNYEEAIKLYTEALNEFKDMTVLWTNRAQAYNKIGEYNKALHDCDWALRVFENCVKAFVQQGKAYLGLKEYNKAIESYQRISVIEPKKQRIVQEYIDEVELCRRKDDEEKQASELFNKGDESAQTVVEILKKIQVVGQPLLYYSGGLRTLLMTINGLNEQTLYRTHHGLELSQNHHILSSIFTKDLSSLDNIELDLLICLLDTHQKAVQTNEESCRHLLSVDGFANRLLTFLSPDGSTGVQFSVLTLLHSISELTIGQATIAQNMDCSKLLSSLLHLLRSANTKISLKAAALLNNLSMNDKFRARVPHIANDLLPTLEAITIQDSHNALTPCCISTLMNLCGHQSIRKSLQRQTATWELCCKLMERYIKTQNNDVTHSLLGFLMNLTFDPSKQLQESGDRICRLCCDVIKSDNDGGCSRYQEETRYRAWNVVSHVLPVCEKATQIICDSNLIKDLVHKLQGSEEDLKVSLKCLTACTVNNSNARDQLLTCQGVALLVPLLSHTDDTIVGNCSLCISHCVSHPLFHSQLSDSNILMLLLSRARDSHNTSTQQNCAILIAKLTQADDKFRDRLRELDGFGILHNILKNIK